MPSQNQPSSRRPFEQSSGSRYNEPLPSQNLPPVVFTRHNRPLHTIWLESQAWFSARDLGRLIGRHLDTHALRKLDPDQTRTLTLLCNGTYQPTAMISESAAYTILLHHYTPENRSLRHWLTHEVITVMRDEHAQHDVQVPSLSLLRWAELSLSMLHWQNEPWIRLRDLPELVVHPHMAQMANKPKAKWRQVVSRIFQT